MIRVGPGWLPNQKSLVVNFLRGFHQVSWFPLLGMTIGGDVQVNFGREVTYNGTWFGADSDPRNTVLGMIRDKALPNDPNGAYFVLPNGVAPLHGFADPDSNNLFCGWHYWTTSGAIKYSYTSYDTTPGRYCTNDKYYKGSGWDQPSPSDGDSALDYLISVVAHELAEIITDPTGQGWYNSAGPASGENADLCNRNFGGDGIRYNQVINGTPYLIQTMWDNTLLKCVDS